VYCAAHRTASNAVLPLGGWSAGGALAEEGGAGQWLGRGLYLPFSMSGLHAPDVTGTAGAPASLSPACQGLNLPGC
jgi:hypothetical protein